jgi:hypothetical protein
MLTLVDDDQRWRCAATPWRPSGYDGVAAAATLPVLASNGARNATCEGLSASSYWSYASGSIVGRAVDQG